MHVHPKHWSCSLLNRTLLRKKSTKYIASGKTSISRFCSPHTCVQQQIRVYKLTKKPVRTISQFQSLHENPSNFASQKTLVRHWNCKRAGKTHTSSRKTFCRARAHPKRKHSNTARESTDEWNIKSFAPLYRSVVWQHTWGGYPCGLFFSVSRQPLSHDPEYKQRSGARARHTPGLNLFAKSYKQT